MKIRPVGAELLHADRRMDGYDELNTRFCVILRTRLKNTESFFIQVLKLSRNARQLMLEFNLRLTYH